MTLKTICWNYYFFFTPADTVMLGSTLFSLLSSFSPNPWRACSLFQRPSKNFESWSSPCGFTSSRSHRLVLYVPRDRPTASSPRHSKDGWAPSWPLFYATIVNPTWFFGPKKMDRSPFFGMMLMFTRTYSPQRTFQDHRLLLMTTCSIFIYFFKYLCTQ